MKTILVVDDNPLLVATYSLALRQEGYRIIEATSGDEGLAMARKHLPDLILSDVDMPNGDGLTLLREIRHDPELKSKQMVLVTGRQDIITPRKGMEDGADDFLLKPIELDTLKSCIEARFRRADINWRIEDKTLAKLRASVPPQLPHELFLPMAGIIGLLELLRADFATFTATEVGDLHTEIYKSALRIQRTLRNYLLVSDLQAAAYQVPPPPLSPQEVEESIQDGIHQALRLHGREGDVSFQGKGCAMAVKSADLSRIVEELVDNACKYSRRGTPVNVVLGADGRLMVSDEGRGMAPEEIERIKAFQNFEPKKDTPGQLGLGLGLVLVQKLSDLAGAKFLIRSQPGEGTQIEVAFPTVA